MKAREEKKHCPKHEEEVVEEKQFMDTPDNISTDKLNILHEG